MYNTQQLLMKHVNKSIERLVGKVMTHIKSTTVQDNVCMHAIAPSVVIKNVYMYLIGV